MNAATTGNPLAYRGPGPHARRQRGPKVIKRASGPNRRFFLRDERRSAPTIADLEQSIFRLRERLQKQEDLLARLEALRAQRTEAAE